MQAEVQLVSQATLVHLANRAFTDSRHRNAAPGVQISQADTAMLLWQCIKKENARRVNDEGLSSLWILLV